MRHTPVPSCAKCPRLAAFRQDVQAEHDDWHNAPVPSFGPIDAQFLIVGLAPGLRGANRTGRPFTGDYAGDLLYPTLLRHGFARGSYGASPDDGLELVNCRITNAVRCVPPANKPLGAEVNACRVFLKDELVLPISADARGHGADARRANDLRAPVIILTLGGIAHSSTLRALGIKSRTHPFAHHVFYPLGQEQMLAASYHCSRYNVNTGRLTAPMFDAVIKEVRHRLDQACS